MSFLLKDEAYDKIIQMINDKKLIYGEIYSLNVLTATMDMSKTPVRDAIQKLVDEKRIDILPSRGIRLHQITKEEVMQHYHFSCAIEGYCVATLAKTYQKDKNNPSVKKLKKLMEQMEKMLDEQKNFNEYFAVDQQFHLELLESLKDPYFSSLKHSSMGFYNHPEIQFTDNKLSRKEVCECHRKILSAICEGDSADAYEALLEHSYVMLKAF
ncbi:MULTISPECIES: GntR family transcriptional regulator [Clostridium]|uniref:GntR family transcriptional regulator n=1 Tax=Clostridium frigoriphilum TaxID=443253 RepID=A0ABU7UQ26_9CLOT|nr:GntR family transcriptional regulator [Clostridium sp. DSM 17811]MBU3100644.1 GntR family transcriptional regulator [Clostridium sp. DSM 17811]